MEKHIIDERTGWDYELKSDYYYPTGRIMKNGVIKDANLYSLICLASVLIKVSLLFSAERFQPVIQFHQFFRIFAAILFQIPRHAFFFFEIFTLFI